MIQRPSELSGGFGPGPLAALASAAQFLHAATAYVIVAAVALHLALGLKRHLVDKDSFLKRMLPF